MTTELRPFPAVLRVGPWQGVPVNIIGAWFDLRGDYVEHHWLPVLGPTSTFLLRRIGEGFEYAPSGFEMDVAETARSLGVSHRGGQNTPFVRAVRRLVAFNVAHWDGDNTLRVYRRVPEVPHRFRSSDDGRLE